MNKKEQNFIASVLRESEPFVFTLLQWAERGVIRNPLDNSLLINYPPITAAAPGGGWGEPVFERALSSLRPDLGAALYIHIPYCTRKCTYCNYFTASKGCVPENYMRMVEKELSLYRQLLGSRGARVRSLYIGGGTPSLLSLPQLERLMECVHRHFTLDPRGETTMEFHPELIRAPRCAAYLDGVAAAGVNRVSVGVQSLDDTVLRAVKRGHDREEALKFLKVVSGRGFAKVNFDIIYGGLPYQSLPSVYRTLRDLLRFNPTSITKHFCEIKKGSADFKRYRALPVLYPNWQENVRTQTMIDMLLTRHGYQKELLHMYTRRREGESGFSHQRQKWESAETVLLCAGPGSYGWIFHRDMSPNLTFYKTFSLKKYAETLRKGLVPVERLAALDKDETARRHIQYAFNYGYLDKAYLRALLQEAPAESGAEIELLIRKLQENDFLNEQKSIYRLTPLGEYLSDEVKALFASRRVLEKSAAGGGHARHHWYPGVEMVKRFKEAVLSEEALNPRRGGGLRLVKAL